MPARSGDHRSFRQFLFLPCLPCLFEPTLSQGEKNRTNDCEEQGLVDGIVAEEDNG